MNRDLYVAPPRFDGRSLAVVGARIADRRARFSAAVVELDLSLTPSR